MTSRQLSTLGLALLALGCGSPTSAALQAPASILPPALLPIGPVSHPKNATFHWKLKVGRLEAGRFWLSVDDVNTATTRVVSGSHSTGVARFFRRVETQAVTLIARDTGATRSSLFERNDQGSRVRVALLYHPRGVRGTVESKPEASRAHTRASAGALAPMNTESFLLNLRRWRPERGGRALATVLAVRDLWLIELEAGEVVTLRTAIGERLAREVRGHATHLDDNGEPDTGGRPKRIRLWLSEDEHRVPLRIEAETLVGKVVVSIVAHEID